MSSPIDHYFEKLEILNSFLSVPNLNVFFEEVFVVKWDNTTCKEILDTNGKFPSSFVFDLQAESSKPALSFYSRHHIKTTKLVEVYNAVYAQVDVASAVRKSYEEDGVDVCCVEGEGFCDENENRRACERDDYYHELDGYGELVTAFYHWQKMLDDADETKQNIIANTGGGSTILNWFNTEQNNQYIEKRVDTTSDMKENVRIDMAYSGVSPESLQDAATPLLTGLQSDLKNTNRIQFSGSSGVYSMTLDRSSSEAIETMTCKNPGINELMDKINNILSYGNPTALAGLAIEGILAKREINKVKEKEAAAENERLKEENDRRNENEKILKQQEEEKAEEEREKKAKEEQEKKEQEEQEKKEQEEKPKKKKSYPDSPKQKDIGVKKGNTKKLASLYQSYIDKKVKNDDDEKKRIDDANKRKEEYAKKRQDDAKKRQDKMKEEEYKRQQERDDESLKDRKETNAAESATKSQSGGGDEPEGNHKKKSFAKGGASKFAFAFSAAPVLIASYFAGCDYTMETEAEPADLEFAASAFGIGVDVGIGGGKFFEFVTVHE